MAVYGWEDFSVLLVNGYDLIPHLVEEVTLPESSVVVDEIRPAGGVWLRRMDSTQRTTKAPLTYTVLHEDGDGTPDELMATLGGDDSFIASIEGNTAGVRGISGSLRRGSRERAPSDGKLTRAKHEHHVNGILAAPVILSQQVQRTAAFDTESASIDNGFAAAVVNITSNSIANPTVVTAAAVHGLVTGDAVVIAGVATSDPTINGVHIVTVLTTLTFTVPVNVTTGGTGGTVRRVSTRNGGIAYIQVPHTTAHPFALDGYTNWIFDVRGSNDNATFAGLTGASLTSTARGHLAIAVSGNIPRYIAAGGALTGAGTSPTASPVIAFHRNPE